MPTTFGERLTALIGALGLLNKQVASEMGITDQSFARYVGTSRVPRHDTMQRIATALAELSGQPITVESLLQDVSVSSSVTTRGKTARAAGGGDQGMFLEQALLSVPAERRDQARLRAMRAALDVVESFRSGVATTRDRSAG